jgi:hypothetical protein
VTIIKKGKRNISNMKNQATRITDPNRKTVISFRQPADINLKAVAARAGVNVNALMRNAIYEYIEQHRLVESDSTYQG